MKKTTLTIGLPIYNEGNNIAKLISDLSKQKLDNIRLLKVIISSDGSDTATLRKISSIKNRHINLIINTDRKGTMRGLNQIIEKANTDILVFLDGDIRIFDSQFLEKLTSPITNGFADLTSCRITAFPPETLFAKVIYKSMELKDILFESHKDGINIFTCHGPARAYSKALYKGLNFPLSAGNDMYSFLDCMKRKFRYKYVESTSVYYKLPATFDDHAKQSLRFRVAKRNLSRYFSSKLISTELHLPFWKLVMKNNTKIIKTFFSNPILSFFYIILHYYLDFYPIQHNYIKETWDISTSSK